MATNQQQVHTVRRAIEATNDMMLLDVLLYDDDRIRQELDACHPDDNPVAETVRNIFYAHQRRMEDIVAEECRKALDTALKEAGVR